MAELIHRRHAVDRIAAVDQHARITREGCRVARHRDNDGNFAGGELFGLRFGALAWRIEHGHVEVVQFLRHQRPAEQVARFGFDRLQSMAGDGVERMEIHHVLA